MQQSINTRGVSHTRRPVSSLGNCVSQVTISSAKPAAVSEICLCGSCWGVWTWAIAEKLCPCSSTGSDKCPCHQLLVHLKVGQPARGQGGKTVTYLRLWQSRAIPASVPASAISCFSDIIKTDPTPSVCKTPEKATNPLKHHVNDWTLIKNVGSWKAEMILFFGQEKVLQQWYCLTTFLIDFL